MLHRTAAILLTSIKRYYALSSKRNEKPTGPLSNRSEQEDLENRCKKTMEEITSQGPIDYDCLDPIPLDWSSLPDEDFSHLDAFGNLDGEQKHSTSSKQPPQPFSSSRDTTSDPGDNRTKYVFTPGELAILFMQDLDRKRRPVVVLSSSFHNRLHNARVLIVPISSVFDNTALYRLFVGPNDTRRGQVIKTDSNLLFDYTSMVSPIYLKPTRDALDDHVLQQTLVWWHRCVKAIASDV